MCQFETASDIYRKHTQSYPRISSNNKEILNLIVFYWFSLLKKFIDEEGEANLPALSRILVDTTEHSLPYAISTYFSGNNKVIEKKSIKSTNFKVPYFILRIIIFISGYKLVLDVLSQIQSSKLSPYFLPLLSKSDLLLVNENAKQEFLNLIDERLIFSEAILAFIKTHLPDAFFMELNNKYDLFDGIDVHCYPDVFLNARSPINLLYVSKSINIIGYQHGANYGMWYENYFELSEKGISTKFHLWFPYKKNYIERFHNEKKQILSNANVSRIVWVGRKKLHKFYQRILPYAYKHLLDNAHLDTIDNEFYDLPHFEFYEAGTGDHSWRPEKSKIVRRGVIEKYIDSTNDILIFDNICETTIFFALKQKIPFLIILNDLKIDGLTETYRKYLEILYSQKFLFKQDDIIEAKLLINEMASSRSLYKERINAIKSILHNPINE